MKKMYASKLQNNIVYTPDRFAALVIKLSLCCNSDRLLRDVKTNKCITSRYVKSGLKCKKNGQSKIRKICLTFVNQSNLFTYLNQPNLFYNCKSITVPRMLHESAKFLS